MTDHQARRLRRHVSLYGRLLRLYPWRFRGDFPDIRSALANSWSSA